MTKWVSDVVPTGMVMQERKQRIHYNCPICGCEKEDTTHILQCQDEKVKLLRDNLLKELQCWLNSIDTHPDITSFVISGLSSWLSSSTDVIINDTLEPSITAAFRSQLNLGWVPLLHGLISRDLIHLQQQYYTSIHSRKLGTRWGIRLIGKLWSFIHQLWIHRNSVLHNTPSIDVISGKEHLIASITSEHEMGIDNLPYVYASYFLLPLQILLSKPVKFQKQWFLIVRSGREASTINPPADQFSNDPSLRRWVGLTTKS